ncbi:UDP-glucose 4-epimerase GalE [Gordonia hydrophobica]|uniref:UDP-glucose 4-epimerase n=1 Tax=Gordonia hydrophobica TaxID=40516 RepID=A0ABZ2U4J3_9ACTN|nr:UDP-glucose 4-epimerase GalE [Gordonia hydrophobica]MBM7368094.1 UDP-glucose 4-epimerase [Gordonia hydrophobica]
MHVLVTGGAGYIGSHTVLQLLTAGHDVTIADDFSNAKPTVLPRLEELADRPIKLHRIDLTDQAATDALFAAEEFDAVIHFAGFKAVGESVAKPLSYYQNNLDTTFSVLRAMDAHGVRRFVFSSSATVYGENPVLERTEDMPTSATNPYGWTKVMVEQVLRDLAIADDSWRIALLRYFNPVGAHVSGRIGEDPSGLPNNLMPFVAQVAVGRRDKLSVFGDDYDTVDGTGVRDYIHVEDLAAGHVAALEKIDVSDEPLAVWNLGSGEPVSVLQVVQAFARASEREIPYEVVPRRPGDLPAYWADPSKANRELGWKATRDIDDMCADTWRWQSQNPQGYPDA